MGIHGKSLGRAVRGAISIISVGAVFACAPADKKDIEANTQMLRAGTGLDKTFLAMDFLATDENGVAIPCGGRLDVSVSGTVRDTGEAIAIPTGAVRVACSAAPANLALVVDNSGSEKGFIDALRAASTTLLDSVLAGGGQASVVRVSTMSEIRAGLTPDGSKLHESLQDLYVANGWTALFDGVRMGNETLGGAIAAAGTGLVFPDSATFCNSGSKRGIVVFTDGRENSSADQHGSEQYPGDGINTTLDDLERLHVNGVTTPIYAVGMGRDVDHDALASLAEQTGGRYRAISRSDQIGDVFSLIGDYVESGYQVCTEIPRKQCGLVDITVSYTFEHPVTHEVVTGTRTESINIQCAGTGPMARTAMVLLTLSNPGIPPAEAQQLIVNTVNYVNPQFKPRVLLVRDNNHHDEFANDTLFITKQLVAAGFDAVYRTEPKKGLSIKDTAGFHVVWFSNPGYPMGLQASFDTLRAFNAAGGAVVLQGDDMAWSMGGAFPMNALTHVSFKDNGTQYCGRAVDNNAYNAAYRVTFAAGNPISAGLENAVWYYADDIDTSTPLPEADVVAASADLTSRDGSQVYCDARVPVVVTFDHTKQP